MCMPCVRTQHAWDTRRFCGRERFVGKWLSSCSVKAYSSHVNLFDPKQRRASNQIDHWCYGDRVKLWDALDRRPLPSLSAQHAFDMQHTTTIAAHAAESDSMSHTNGSDLFM